MTNKEILTKAIEQAIVGGWEPVAGSGKPTQFRVMNPDASFVSFEHPDYSAFDRAFYRKLYPEQIIFNHDFAKALWGEENPYTIDDSSDSYKHTYMGPVWKYHLQQMVVADDPIAYLKENI